jgi:hypothetical protein
MVVVGEGAPCPEAPVLDPAAFDPWLAVDVSWYHAREASWLASG